MLLPDPDEPYVVCGDLYSMTPNVARWLELVFWFGRLDVPRRLEGIWGFYVQGQSLKLDPCIPRSWPGFEITFRYSSARYDMVIENPDGVSKGVVRTEFDDQVLTAMTGLVPHRR